MFFVSVCSAGLFLICYVYYWFKYWGASLKKIWIPLISPIIGFFYGFISGIIPCINIII